MCSLKLFEFSRRRVAQPSYTNFQWMQNIKNVNSMKRLLLTRYETGAVWIMDFYIRADVKVMSKDGALDFTTGTPDLIELHLLLL